MTNAEILQAYEDELEIVTKKIQDITESGKEHEIKTSSGMGTRLTQVELTVLHKRQKELISVITDYRSIEEGTNSRVSVIS